MKKIVFTGPESSGKTTLTKRISKLYSSVFVLEYAREYLLELGKEYVQDDLFEIAKKQFEKQSKSESENVDYAFFDTDLLTIKVWSEFKYDSCNEFTLKNILRQDIDLYVLCKPDFDWKKDELRENPNDRNELYAIYKKELISYGFPFIEIGGSIEKRIKLIQKELK